VNVVATIYLLRGQQKRLPDVKCQIDDLLIDRKIALLQSRSDTTRRCGIVLSGEIFRTIRALGTRTGSRDVEA
jgi:hypothetical protein